MTALFPVGTIFRDPHHCRVWTCTKLEFRFVWMKLCSSDNHYTTWLSSIPKKNLRFQFHNNKKNFEANRVYLLRFLWDTFYKVTANSTWNLTFWRRSFEPLDRVSFKIFICSVFIICLLATCGYFKWDNLVKSHKPPPS